MLKQRIAFFENLSLQNGSGTGQEIISYECESIESISCDKRSDFNYEEIPVQIPLAKCESIDFGLNEFGCESDDDFIIEIINDHGRPQMNKVFVKVLKVSLFDERNQNSSTVATQTVSEPDENVYHENDEESFQDSEPDCVINYVDDNFESCDSFCDSVFSEINSIYSGIYEDLSEYAKSIPQDTATQTQGKYEYLQSKPNQIQSNDFRLTFILDELIATEESYLLRLYSFLNSYQSKLQDLDENISIVFRNAEDILFNSIDFFDQLKKNRSHPKGIAQTFLKSVTLFEIYPQYAIHRHRADIHFTKYHDHIKEIEENAQHCLDFNNYLHIPIQRLGQYGLFLEKLQQELSKMNQPIEKVSQALELVKIKMKKCNDLIVIDSINKSVIDLETKGAYITKERFSLIAPVKLEVIAFLFEHVILFCLDQPMKADQHLYFDHINMEDIRTISKRSKVDKQLCLENFTKIKEGGDGSRYVYILEAKDEKIKKCWLEMIEKMLWNQFEKFKAEQLNNYKPFSEAVEIYIRTPRIVRNIFVESFRSTLESR